MGKLRSVDTNFWEDPWVEELTPKDKLLFLYLLTNTKTNMLGIYEVSISKISFETGLTKDEVRKGFEGFERVRKAFYISNHVVLSNFVKNQKMNANMKTSAVNEYKNLPLEVLNALSSNGSEGFERVNQGFQMVRKVEVEREREVEEEIEEEKDKPVLSLEPINLYPNLNIDKKEVFETWINYRIEIKKKIKVESTLNNLIEKFNSNTLEDCLKAVNGSVDNQYTGLFWNNNNNSNYGKQEQQQQIKQSVLQLANNSPEF